MTFEFTSQPHFDFITEFSAQFNLNVINNTLTFPEEMGDGYIRKVSFGDDFRLLVHRYKLNEDLTIIRKPSEEANDLISIFFYNNEQPIDLTFNKEKPIKFSRQNESAIQITTTDLHSIIRFPAQTETHYIVIGITAKRLAELLNNEQPNEIIDTITSGNTSFLYFESMNVEMQQLLKHIATIQTNESLSQFYTQIKVQELLFFLFKELIKRTQFPRKPINNADVANLMKLRSIILSDLSVPPVLATLSERIGMSETKMKQLFKQTFGDTIYNYYQKVRMEEAAFLLKQGRYSVSQVGFELGFTNLSHFSRLFERYYHLTPKKFSSVG
jgi:AraC-like DNA-binding protein